MGDQINFSRRDFVRLVILGASGVALAACQRATEPLTRALNAPTATDLPPGTPSPKLVDGIPITSNADFYSVSIGRDPRAVPNDWRLAIAGLVNTPLALTLADLQAMPTVTEMRTMECISNPAGGDLIGNAVWQGVRFKDVLARAGVKPDAHYIQIVAFDEFSAGIPLELGMHDHALLAYAMNGAPLPLEHGAPLRCLLPGRFGMKQPKWIQSMVLRNDDYAGYWDHQGWSHDAFILPNSRIDAPQDGGMLTGATFTMSGIAFSGEDGIAKIEIGWDETNAWRAADLTRGATPFVWTTWRWSGNALTPGKHTLLARVTDRRGREQTRAQAINLLDGTFPNGTMDMHTIVVEFQA